MCVWVEDADSLTLTSDSLNVVFSNRIISTYLKGNVLGLSGIKGQGKTFLIKVKRKKLASERSLLCLPKDRMVDVIDESLDIDSTLFTYLTDYSPWVRIWKYAICFTLIKCKELSVNTKAFVFNSETKRLLSTMREDCKVSSVFSRLLGMERTRLSTVLRDTQLLTECVESIRNEVCVFIDKVDQTFMTYLYKKHIYKTMPSLEKGEYFWNYAQYSLAEASYDIIANINPHIRVYYTIRQEAVYNCINTTGDKARNIMANIITLLYSKEDLKNMYMIYIENESDANLIEPDEKHSKPSIAFVGLDSLQNTNIPTEQEDIFDYIYRHTFKRPFDIMKICRNLYLRDVARDADSIRVIVNETSDDLYEMYISELSIFLPYTKEQLNELIRSLPGNILDFELLKSICINFYNNEYVPIDIAKRCRENCINCLDSHPFAVLYSIGLLGRVTRDLTNQYSIQDYKTIGRSITQLYTSSLPKSDWYFLHPAINNLARNLRRDRGLPFVISTNIIVGDKCKYSDDKVAEINSQVMKCKRIFRQQRVFISSTVDDLVAEREEIRAHLLNSGIYPIMSDRDDFDLLKTTGMHSHDVCLDEVKKCANLIFLLGTSTGGEYKGYKYLDEKQEIIGNSNGRITNPSISLMELYVARKNNIRCYVFRNKSIEEAHKKKELPQQLSDEINFINHFNQSGKIEGNWMVSYQDIPQLIDYISRLRFVYSA